MGHTYGPCNLGQEPESASPGCRIVRLLFHPIGTETPPQPRSIGLRSKVLGPCFAWFGDTQLFITVMFLKPAKALRQLPQIVSIRADRQLARASKRILQLLSDRWDGF